MNSYGFSVGSSGYDDEDRLVNWQRSDTNLDQSWNPYSLGHFINDVYRFLCVRKPDYPTYILKGDRPMPATMAQASLVVTIQQQS